MKIKVDRIAGAICAFAISLFIVGSYPQNVAIGATPDAFRSLSESDLLILGVVDRVDASKREFEVLGQLIAYPANQRAVAIESLIGHVVAVFGAVNANGSIDVRSVRELPSVNYVAGATQLYLKGIVASVDTVNGTAKVGSLSINYAGALHTLAATDLVPGRVASFSGLAFSGSPKFYADNGFVHGVTGLQSVNIGSDKLGQTGSDKLGQTGSDKLGQTGSDARLGR